VNIHNDEHLCLIGTTGAGKSVLSAFLLEGSTRSLILDPKREIKMDGWRNSWRIPLLDNKFNIIVKPKRTEDRRMAMLVLEALRRKNIRIYVDELASIDEYFPETLQALGEVARVGRSRHVTLWSAFQRPRFVPKIFMTEARVFIAFMLTSADDRHHVAGFIGDIAEDPIPLYDFWYFRPGMTQPQLLHLDLPTRTIQAKTPPEPMVEEWEPIRKEEVSV
jgi:hypothetical protein